MAVILALVCVASGVGGALPSSARVVRGGFGLHAGASAALDAAQWAQEPPIRIGHGFDIHRMAPHGDPEVGGPVTIGGVVFADFELGIVAHSDGDVIYHSVVDSIFGALTLPDIGQVCSCCCCTRLYPPCASPLNPAAPALRVPSEPECTRPARPL
jgi:hypothetical protein